MPVWQRRRNPEVDNFVPETQTIDQEGSKVGGTSLSVEGGIYVSLKIELLIEVHL